MEIESLNNQHSQPICRICLGYKDDMKCVFNVASVIMSCASVQIEYGDGLPPTICSPCIQQANQAYEFRLLCEQSDNVLRKKTLKENIFPIKTESYRQETNSPEPIVDIPYSPCNNTSNSSQNVPLKIEIYEGSSSLIETNQQENSVSKLLHNSIMQNSLMQNSLMQNSLMQNTLLPNPLLQNSLLQNPLMQPKTSDSDKSEDNNTSFLLAGNKIRKREIKLEVNDDPLGGHSDRSDNDSEPNKNKTELSCRYCDMKFRSKIRHVKHEIKHKNGFKCHICGKDYPTSRQLYNHINIHSRKGAHLCQICGKQFTLPENLVRHQRIHTGVRPYKCEQCTKSFTQSNELKSHLVTHSSEKHHLCSVCGNKYSRTISLKVHMRRVHSIPPNLRLYICTVCGRNFKDRRDLAQHTLIHTGERSHVCTVCNKAFNRSSNLRVHERIHSGHRPHVCPICQRAFIQKHVLVTHMKTHPKIE